MNQEIPKYNETFNPILDILINGEIIQRRDLIKQVIVKNYSHFPKELLEEKIKSGDILIENRIAWGISYLKQSDFVSYPKRGYVQITSKGKEQNKKLTLKDVQLEISKSLIYNDNKVIFLENKEIQTSSPEDLIDEGFNQIEKEVKNELLERLKLMDPYYFEKVILILLKKNGIWGFYRNT